MKKVDIVELQALQARLHRVENMLSYQNPPSESTATMHIPIITGAPCDSGHADSHIPPGQDQLTGQIHLGFSSPRPRATRQVTSNRAIEQPKNERTNLGHNHDLLSRKIEMLDRIPQHNLGCPSRVHVRSVETLDSQIVPEKIVHTSNYIATLCRQESTTVTHAALICLNASSSGNTQSIHLGSP